MQIGRMLFVSSTSVRKKGLKMPEIPKGSRMAIHHRLLHGHRPHPPGRKSKIQTARLEFRFWILDFGFWVLDLGFRILDFGLLQYPLFVWKAQTRPFRFWILDFGFWILDLLHGLDFA